MPTLLEKPDSLSLGLVQAQKLANLKYQQGRFASLDAISPDWLASEATKANTIAAGLLSHSHADGMIFNYAQAQSFAAQINLQQLTPDVIRQLHQQLHPKGGQWRQLSLSQPLRHQPQQKHLIKNNSTSPELLVAELIEHLKEAIRQNIDALIAVPLFAYHFLLLFPFLNGNRRVALLLAKQLLAQHGHEALNYQALELSMVGSDPQFYHQLYLCSQQQAPIQDWLSYWWQHIDHCYQRFDKAIKNNHIKKHRGGKTQLIQATIPQLPQPFSLTELQQQLPSIGFDLIRKVVRSERDKGLLQLTGRGRGAKWLYLKSN